MTILRDPKRRVETLEHRDCECDRDGWGAAHVAGLVCVVGAVIVAALGQNGWGWLLLVAVLIFC